MTIYSRIVTFYLRH